MTSQVGGNNHKVANQYQLVIGVESEMENTRDLMILWTAQICVGFQAFRYGFEIQCYAFAWLVILSVSASQASSCPGNRIPMVPNNTVSVSCPA